MTINGNQTIEEALYSATSVLMKNKSILTPRLDCEVLLSFLLNCERIRLIIEKEMVLEPELLKKFQDMVYRRAKNEPVSYIIAQKEFMSLNFFVAPGVLIPRPETEFLVEYVVQRMKACPKPTVLDLCTGSGAIAISIAHYLKNAFVTAVDKYDVCVSTAEKNAKKHAVSERVQVLQADIFEKLPIDRSFHCLVSNPPYIRKNVLASLPDDVKKFEPIYALDGGSDGLIFYRRIAEIAQAVLEAKGVLALEIGFDQGEEVTNLLKECKSFHNIQVTKDYAGLDRMITAEKKGTA